ncbi:MAG: hypothetical protein Q9213_000408 [Squamulea squamosa]
MEVVSPSQQVHLEADPLGAAYKTHTIGSMPAPIKFAGKRAKPGSLSMAHTDSAQQPPNPDFERPFNHTDAQKSQCSAQRGTIVGADKPLLDPFRHRQSQQPLQSVPGYASPSRPPLAPSGGSEVGIGIKGSPPRTPVRDIKVEGLEHTPWHEYKIPKELEILQPNVPNEIRGIIQDSLDGQRAIRLSRMQAPPIGVRSTINTHHESHPANAELVVAESSAMASNRHPRSTSSSVRTDSLELSLNSATSLGSSTAGKERVDRLDNWAADDTQRLDLDASSRKFKKSPEKLSKARAVLKRLRRPKDALVAVGIERKLQSYECTSCFDNIPNREAIGVPCRHRYCAPCFSQLIATALQNENHFPPKCCLQEIPRRVLRKHLQAKELASFDDKALEYAVAIGNRYYCSRPECAKWIDTTKARSQNGALECPHCSYSICTICRGPVHPADQDCPQDFGLNSTLEQAERAGWQRCYNCRALVELNRGCRHITCHCRAEFCYTCGARWRTCTCTEADQAQRAHRIRVNLERPEAEARAEEEEIRAAIAAVEEAERQAAEALQEEERRQEEERAEEAKQITMREFQRIEKFVQHYNRLRDILENVRLAQNDALTLRHHHELDELESKEIALVGGGGREKDPENSGPDGDLEKAGIISTTDIKMQGLRQKHATELIQTRTRHRHDEDAFLCKITESSDHNEDEVVDPATKLEALLSAQELERSTLRSIQAREIEKWKKRGAMYLTELEEKNERLEMERQRGLEAFGEEVKQVKRGQWADWKWVEVVGEERVHLLGENERTMMLNGGEVGGARLEKDEKEIGEDGAF